MKLPKRLRHEPIQVGQTTDERSVFNGKIAWYIVDTVGLPFSILIEQLHLRSLVIDMEEYLKLELTQRGSLWSDAKKKEWLTTRKENYIEEIKTLRKGD